VAEVASLGGFERQYQIVVDPDRLVASGSRWPTSRDRCATPTPRWARACWNWPGASTCCAAAATSRTLADLEQSVVTVGAGGTPIRLGDVARVRFGPRFAAAPRIGTARRSRRRHRRDAHRLECAAGHPRAEARDRDAALPDGVSLIPTYDRSELILGSVDTLDEDADPAGVIVTIICLVFLFHARSAVVVMIVLPLSVLLSFIAIRYLGLTSNIMSLGGIAIAIGELADAAIVLIENAHVRLAAAPPGSDRRRIIVDACKEVGRPIFFSMLLITVSFLPIFTLTGQAGRLFMPLAYTKTFAMFAAAILSITLAPPLMVLLLRGRFRTEATNPVSRMLRHAVYRPIAQVLVVRFRIVVVAAAVMLMIGTVPTFQRLGSEFMPPLDEGSLLVMPTTFPGIAIEEARRALTAQNRIIMRFPEVASVHGKVGRAETATDPGAARHDRVGHAAPAKEWPTRYTPRWYSTRRPTGRSARCGGCGPSSAGRGRSPSCRATWMPRCACRGTRWRSRRRSARASTC
jgi:copper/silver efflux system protein